MSNALSHAAFELCRTQAPVVVEFTAPDGREGRCHAYSARQGGLTLIVCSDHPDLESAVSIADAVPAAYEAAEDEFDLAGDDGVVWIEHLPANRFRPSSQLHQVSVKNGRPTWKPLGYAAPGAAA